jgi:hypothetical protein
MKRLTEIDAVIIGQWIVIGILLFGMLLVR